MCFFLYLANYSDVHSFLLLLLTPLIISAFMNSFK